MSGESAPVLLIPASAPHSRQTLNMHSILHFADVRSDCVCYWTNIPPTELAFHATLPVMKVG